MLPRYVALIGLLLSVFISSRADAICGDSDLEIGEDCDDGNTAIGDGCDAACAVETGWSCDTSEPSVCSVDVCAAAELVSNGNFDANETDWQDDTDDDSIHASETVFGGTVAANRVARLRRLRRDLDQDITGMIIGATYRISVSMSPRTAGNRSCAAMETAMTRVNLSGSDLGNFDLSADGPNFNLVANSTTFTATATSGLLELDELAGSDCDQIIDDVSIVLTDTNDLDGDGLDDLYETCISTTDIDDVDTSGDGYCDGTVRVSTDVGFGTCAICGDAFTDMPTEACDDNNATDGDGCTSCAIDVTATCDETPAGGTSVCTFPALYSRLEDVNRLPDGRVQVSTQSSKLVKSIGLVEAGRLVSESVFVPVIPIGGEAGHYRFKAPVSNLFYIVEKWTTGEVKTRGPFSVDNQVEVKGNYAPTLTEFVAPKGHVRTPPMRQQTEAMPLSLNDPVASVIVEVQKAGIQRIGFDALASASGQSLEYWRSQCEQGTIQVSDQMSALSIHCDETSIGFYVPNTDLVFNSGHPLRIDSEAAVSTRVIEEATGRTTGAAAELHHTLRFEEDTFAGPTAEPNPREDLYFWKVVSGAYDNTSNVTLESDLTLVGEGTFSAEVFVLGDSVEVMDVFMGNERLGSLTFSGAGRHRESLIYDVGSEELRGDLRLVMTSGDSGLFVDSIEATQSLSNPNEAFVFTAHTDGVVSGMDELWDVTIPTSPTRLQLDEGGRAGLRADATYARDTSTPLHLRPASSFDKGDAVDVVLIYPKALEDAANRYREIRKKHSVAMWAIEDIFDDLGKGMRDPKLIALAVANATEEWGRAPNTVVLFGDGHMDYRSVETDKSNLIPPVLKKTGYGLYPSDKINGVVVGRIPVSTTEEANRYLDKLEAYDPKLASDLDLLALSGDGDVRFDIQANQMIEEVPSSDWIDESFGADALLGFSGLKIGQMIYTGHGGLNGIGKEEWLTPEHFSNLSVVPVFVAATCLVNLFSFPAAYEGFGESLIRMNGGALVMLAPTSPVDSQTNYLALSSWMKGQKRDSLGVTVHENKVVFDTFAILGDPLLPLIASADVPSSPEKGSDTVDESTGGCRIGQNSPWRGALGFMMLVGLLFFKRQQSL